MQTKPTTLTKGGVLLIEADSSLQHSVRAALEAENYEVLPAASRDEAQPLFNADSITILVIDADYEPERLGPLVAQFKAQRPQLRTIGIRGAQNGAVKANLAGVNAWMQKPPRPTLLVATVNHLLAELRSEIFREEMLRRRTAPLFTSGPYRCGVGG